jgi:hypothetical protein
VGKRCPDMGRDALSRKCKVDSSLLTTKALYTVQVLYLTGFLRDTGLERIYP